MTVLTYDMGMADVKAINGDTHLGGQDFTNRIVDRCVDFLKENSGVDIRGDKKKLMGLIGEADKAKRMLSAAISTEIYVPALADDEDFDYSLSRVEFERLCAPELNKIIPCIERALKDAGLRKEDMDSIVLAGGSCRIPKV